MKKIRKSLLLVAMSLVMIISLIGCTSNKGTHKCYRAEKINLY